MQEAAEAQYVPSQMNNKLLSAASSYNIERSLIARRQSRIGINELPPHLRVSKVGAEKRPNTAHGSAVRNVPGTRSEARPSERSVTLACLGVPEQQHHPTFALTLLAIAMFYCQGVHNNIV